ncbi:MAG: DUF1285 domain-containing protein [Pseudomonadota bacterium]
MLAFASKAADAADRSGGRPPVEKWNPPFCGDIPMRIAADGVWFYEGTPIGRAPLVRLFSTILKREGEEHFLVTPVEKVRIEVEDAPFQAIRVDAETGENGQRLVFQTNLGDRAAIGPDRPLAMRETATGLGTAPYFDVRDGLEARVSRSVLFDLVALGEEREIDGAATMGVVSDGGFFALGPVEEPVE